MFFTIVVALVDKEISFELVIAIIKLAIGISEEYITKYTLTTKSSQVIHTLVYILQNQEPYEIILLVSDNIFTVVFQ